jgi:uncharacterized membrane protein YcaP (DUF421 family)
MTEALFGGWAGLLRVLVVGTAAYVALVFLLRVSGKRTLSKMNAFDFVVTVALGSTLATTLLDRTLPLAEGVLAFALLIALQFVITWASVRSRLVRRLVKSEPALLVHRGAPLEGALRAARVTRDEVEAALRGSGIGAIAEAESVVLETDGTLSAIRREGGPADPPASGGPGRHPAGSSASSSSTSTT